MTKREKKNVFEMITEKIVAQLDKGVIPWRKTWKGGVVGLPRNATTGRPYRGVNVFLLLMAGFDSPLWLTFKQAKKLGGSVRKGERATMIVFWKTYTKEVEDDNGETKKEKRFILRYYNVFNLDQTENVKLPKKIAVTTNMDHVSTQAGILEAAEAIVNGFRNPPTIETRGNQPAYSPPTDTVRMPKREMFVSLEAYYQTLFHELTHATGHSSRLDRAGVMDATIFGSEKYADEELVAEFGASYLAGVAGIADERGIENAAAYIAGWKKKLIENPKTLVYAAQRAQKAADWILGDTFDLDADDEGGE